MIWVNWSLRLWVQFSILWKRQHRLSPQRSLILAKCSPETSSDDTSDTGGTCAPVPVRYNLSGDLPDEILRLFDLNYMLFLYDLMNIFLCHCVRTILILKVLFACCLRKDIYEAMVQMRRAAVEEELWCRKFTSSREGRAKMLENIASKIREVKYYLGRKS